MPQGSGAHTMASPSPTKRKRARPVTTASDATPSPSKRLHASDKHASAAAVQPARSADATSVTLSVAGQDATNHVGPVLASFSDFVPPGSTPFTLYRAPGILGKPSGSKAAAAGDAEVSPSQATTSATRIEDRLMLVGETQRILYHGSNLEVVGGSSSSLSTSSSSLSRSRARAEAGYSASYLVGIYDPTTSTVTLRAAPLFTVSRSVRSLRTSSTRPTMPDADIINPTSAGLDYESRLEARKQLGETFGNRKTKIKARNDERMKVDTSSMATGLLESLSRNIDQSEERAKTSATTAQKQQGNVAGGSASQPSRSGEAEEGDGDATRLLPSPHHEATAPSDVYPLADLIPDSLLDSLDVAALARAESIDELAKKLPGPGPAASPWLTSRAWQAVLDLRRAGPSSAAAIAGAGGDEVAVGPVNKPRHTKFEADDDDSGPGAVGFGPPLPQTQQQQQPVGILKATNSSQARLRLKLCLYVALLWAFRRHGRLVSQLGKDLGSGASPFGADDGATVAKDEEGEDGGAGASKGRANRRDARQTLVDRLRLGGGMRGGGGAEVVLDHLLRRFTEMQRGASLQLQITNFSETKLLARLLTCCLHLDQFSLDSAQLAMDLGLAPTKVNDVLRSLGCRSVLVRERAGASETGTTTTGSGNTKSQRRMVLSVPLQLPKPSKGRPVTARR